MRNLLTSFLVIITIILALHAWRTEVRLNTDEDEIVQRTEYLQTYINVQVGLISDSCIDHANAVQDSIEKRLGDVERSINDLEYIYRNRR